MSGEKEQELDRGDKVAAAEDKKTEDTKVDAKEAEKVEAADKEQGDDVDAAKAKQDALADDADADKGDEAEDKSKGIKVPKARLDEAQRKAKAREKELNDKIMALEAKVKETDKQDPATKLQATKDKIATLRDQYEELLFDGKKAEARKVRNELTTLEEQLADWKTAARAEERADQKLQTLKYEAALAKAESEFPALDPDSESHDPEKEDEVAEMYTAYVKAGYHRHVALEKAVKYVMGPTKKAKVTEPDATVKQKREEEARKKAAEADKKQPASLSKAGVDSDKAGTKEEGGVDVMRMSISAFDKLSEETKAKLRGDAL